MKRILPFVLAVVMMAISCTKEKESKEEPYNPDGSPITQAQALEIVKKDIDMYDVVYISRSIVKKGTKLLTYMSESRQRVVPFDSWIVIIDSDPYINGGQKWLYIYVDAYTGNADTDSMEWGIANEIEIDDVKCVTTKSGTESEPSLFSESSIMTRSITHYSNNWAVIISGGANIQSNYERYWNDCSAIYK